MNGIRQIVGTWVLMVKNILRNSKVFKSNSAKVICSVLIIFHYCCMATKMLTDYQYSTQTVYQRWL